MFRRFGEGQGLAFLTLEVRGSNQAARALYARHAAPVEVQPPQNQSVRRRVAAGGLGLPQKHRIRRIFLPHLLGYDTALFGVHFKTICWADPLPEETELLRRHQEIYLSQFGRDPPWDAGSSFSAGPPPRSRAGRRGPWRPGWSP